METMGERIRAEREAQEMSRAALATRAGIAPTTLSDLELGYSNSSRALHRIAETLDVRAKWLEFGTGPKRFSARPGDNPGIAELRMIALLMAQALADAAPDAARRLVDRLESLPGEMPQQPFPRGLIDTIRAELAQQALLPAHSQQAPEPDASKRR